MCAVQTGMRGAFGKPQGTCARVAIGQILLSIRCKDVHSPQVCHCLAILVCASSSPRHHSEIVWTALPFSCCCRHSLSVF